MEFGFLNLLNGILVALILIPNVVYAVKVPNQENKCTNRWMNALEQLGRYGCMALMVLPLGVWKFGFPSVEDFLLYGFGNVGLLAAYWIVWGLYFKKVTPRCAMALVMLPAGIFLLTGLTLRHWLLVLFAAVFAIAHGYVTSRNL